MQLSADIMAFTIAALRQMKFDVDGADADTVLGPAGIDVDSLGVVELSLRVEEAFGVKLTEEDMEGFAPMTLGEFASDIARRSELARGRS